jgi:hypothetical protein
MITVEQVFEGKFHFITSYPDNKYIEKTVAYIYRDEYKNGKLVISEMGRLEVYMRNGEKYSFETYVTGTASQYGIQVSDDGKYIYVISNIKGLWCYTCKGEIVWKTRYTSVEAVFPHIDGKITCVMSNYLAILDENGKIIKKVPTSGEGSQGRVSDDLIASMTSWNVLTLFDSMTLEKKYRFALDKLGLRSFSKAKIEGDFLIIKGWPLNEDIEYPIEVKLSLEKLTEYCR